MSPPIETYSLALSVGLAALAAGLIGVQLYGRRNRPGDLDAQDVRHFGRQKIRRGLVAAVMLVLSAAIYTGARLPHISGGKPNLRFVETWLGIFALVFVLMLLAGIDWVATRRYAVRHGRAILDQGLQTIRDDFHRRESEKRQASEPLANGDHDDPAPRLG